MYSNLLIEAAYAGKKDVLEAAVNEGVQLNSVVGTLEDRIIPIKLIHAAAFGGHQSLLVWLINEQGCSYKKKCENNQIEDEDSNFNSLSIIMVDILIQALIVVISNDINISLRIYNDSIRWTILYWAACGGHVDLIEWILTEWGFPIEDQDEKKNTFIDILMEKDQKKAEDWIMKKSIAGVSLLPAISAKWAIRQEAEKALKIFKTQDEILHNILFRLSRIQQSNDLVEQTCEALSSPNFTHKQRLVLLKYASDVQSLVEYAENVRLNEIPFVYDEHRVKAGQIPNDLEKLKRKLDAIMQHDRIRNNWVRVRIWEGGYFKDNTDYIADGGDSWTFSRLLYSRLFGNSSNQQNENVGHVSLETANGYMSFWPDSCKQDASIDAATQGLPARTQSLIDDMRCEGPDARMNKHDINKKPKEPDYEAVFFSLNVKELNDYCLTLVKMIESRKIQFSLGAKKHKNDDIKVENCVTLSYNLLLRGEINDLKTIEEPVSGILTPYWLEAGVKLAWNEERNRYPICATLNAPRKMDVVVYQVPEEERYSHVFYRVNTECHAIRGETLSVDTRLRYIDYDYASELYQFSGDNETVIILSPDVVEQCLHRIPSSKRESLLHIKAFSQSKLQS